VQRAEDILDTLQDISESVDGDDPLLCGPSRASFYAVLQAYARAGRPNHIMRILDKWLAWRHAQRTLVTPNAETYALVLQAWVRHNDTNHDDAAGGGEPARV